MRPNLKKTVDKLNFCAIILLLHAGVAHPVERHLAKVEVASSSLVTRSKGLSCLRQERPFFHTSAGLSYTGMRR